MQRGQFLTVQEFGTKMFHYLNDFRERAIENTPGETHTFWDWFDTEFDIYMQGVDE